MTSERVTKIGMKPVHPGRFVRMEILEDLGLSVARAAEMLGVRRAALSPEMALRLEKAFGVSMDTLLRLQAWYDAERMRAQADEVSVEPYVTADTAT